MSYRIWNTALDHTKRFLHRRASKMQMEPVLAGRRLRIRTSMVITDAIFEHNKANIELYKSWGVVDYEKVGGEKKPSEVVVPKKVEPIVTKAVEAKPVEVVPTPFAAPPAPAVITESAPSPFHVEDKQVPPPAETAPTEIKPPPKSPYKGKKQY